MAATPTLSALRTAVADAIKLALNATPALVDNVVHTYRRFWRDGDKFRKLFKRTDAGAFQGKINGWMVTRRRTREEETSERWRFYNIHRLELHGYLGVQDAVTDTTEEDFQAQVEVIRDNLRLNFDVFGDTERVTPVCQVEDISPIEIGEHSCWYALLSLETENIETKTVASP